MSKVKANWDTDSLYSTLYYIIIIYFGDIRFVIQ